VITLGQTKCLQHKRVRIHTHTPTQHTRALLHTHTHTHTQHTHTHDTHLQLPALGRQITRSGGACCQQQSIMALCEYTHTQRDQWGRKVRACCRRGSCVQKTRIDIRGVPVLFREITITITIKRPCQSTSAQRSHFP